MTPAARGLASRVEIRFPLPGNPAQVFTRVTDQMTDGLRRRGVRLEPRSGGRVAEGETDFGRVIAWLPGREVVVEVRPVSWAKSPTVTVRVALSPRADGTMVSLSVDGWRDMLEESDSGWIDWTAGTLLPRVLEELTPHRLGDWMTDRAARRPTGESAVSNYRDPQYHWPNFLRILDLIQLTATDRLLEVACGGGAFLRKALESGCTAFAIDHSPDMVRTARELNRASIAAGRATIEEAEADRLPVPSNAFTWCVCTGAFNFFPDPQAALRQMLRALVPGGKVVIYVSSASLRGTEAAPEPVASRIHWHTPAELARLARAAGFVHDRVEGADEERYARKVGLPEEAIAFFRGTRGSHLLIAQKPIRRAKSSRRRRAKRP